MTYDYATFIWCFIPSVFVTASDQFFNKVTHWAQKCTNYLCTECYSRATYWKYVDLKRVAKHVGWWHGVGQAVSTSVSHQRKRYCNWNKYLGPDTMNYAHSMLQHVKSAGQLPSLNLQHHISQPCLFTQFVHLLTQKSLDTINIKIMPLN